MDRLEIKGTVNTAICYARVVEEDAVEQIRRMCDYDFTKGSQIRIMPDVHAGKGCTIGTTMTIQDKAVPNIVGVDIGCGMLTTRIAQTEIDLEKLDAAAHFIAEESYSVKYGARNMRRYIQRNVEDYIAESIISDTFGKITQIHLSVKNGRLSVDCN